MASFASVAELGKLLGRTFAAGTETEQAQLALDVATADIKIHAGQQIEKIDNEAVTLDADGSKVLFLPEQPVLAVDAVSVEGVALVVISDVYWYRDGSLYRRSGLSWGTERQSVVVTYDHGYAAIPTDIKGVCMRRAARFLDNPTSTIRRTSVDDATIEYADTAASEAFTDPEREILDAYRPAIVA